MTTKLDTKLFIKRFGHRGVVTARATTGMEWKVAGRLLRAQ